MAEPDTNDLLPARGFPFITAATSLGILFTFLVLMVLAYRSPNYLDEYKTNPQPIERVKLDEMKARNQALLDGANAKMPVSTATAELLGQLKSETDRLPFPIPEPAAPIAPAPKKN